MRALALSLSLTACTPSLTEVRRPVDATIEQRLGKQERVDPRALLAKPLDKNAAVAIALANSPRLAAAFDSLGIAGGELGAALGLGPLDIHGALRFGHDLEYEVDVVQDVLGVIASGKRRAAARADLEAVQAEAAAQVLRLVARVEMAFADLLAAQQELVLRREAFEAADAGAALRERMHAADTTSTLAQARERDAREQARLDVGRAEADVEIKRERLNGLLGLSGRDTVWTATGALAELPATAPALDGLETASVAASLELAAGRARTTAAANRASDERLRTVLPILGIGASVHDDGDGWALGPVVRLGIPLFDQRAGQRMRATAEARRAGNELTASAVELRASARAARIAALAAYQEARHVRTVLLPLRQQILDESVKHYNAMDTDPFALVTARRDLVEGHARYLDALRRYWRAMAEVAALQRGVSVTAGDLAEQGPRAVQRTQEDH